MVANNRIYYVVCSIATITRRFHTNPEPNPDLWLPHHYYVVVSHIPCVVHLLLTVTSIEHARCPLVFEDSVVVPDLDPQRSPDLDSPRELKTAQDTTARSSLSATVMLSAIEFSWTCKYSCCVHLRTLSISLVRSHASGMLAGL